MTTPVVDPALFRHSQKKLFFAQLALRDRQQASPDFDEIIADLQSVIDFLDSYTR